MKRFITILAILAAVVLTDVHWGVMQTVTWVKMVSESDSSLDLSTRLINTVSGLNKCDRCHVLENERNSEQEETLNLIAKSQIIAPISAAQLRFSHPGEALFVLNTAVALHSELAPPGIEHPPRA